MRDEGNRRRDEELKYESSWSATRNHSHELLVCVNIDISITYKTGLQRCSIFLIISLDFYIVVVTHECPHSLDYSTCDAFIRCEGIPELTSVWEIPESLPEKHEEN